MSPFSNSKMSPFVRRGGDGIGQRSGDDELRGGGSRGADSGGGGEAYAAARGGETAWDRGAPSQAVGSAISVGRSGGAGIASSREAAEQCHRGGSSAGSSCLGAEAVRGFRADLGVREAGGGARSSIVGGDVAAVDDGPRGCGGRRRVVRFGCTRGRPRRACVGDLVQIDGSPHDWFEGRGPLCTLIVYVDDATTRLMASGFFPAETTEAYMETTRAHLAACGRPVAYYSDRYGVFRVNKKGKENELTQFGRALKTLDIASIHAGSPQAKGRVETGEPHASGSVGEGDAAARDRRHGGGQRVPAGVHGGLQRAFSRWRRGIRRTRTGRCCTRPGSWT